MREQEQWPGPGREAEGTFWVMESQPCAPPSCTLLGTVAGTVGFGLGAGKKQAQDPRRYGEGPVGPSVTF